MYYHKILIIYVNMVLEIFKNINLIINKKMTNICLRPVSGFPESKRLEGVISLLDGIYLWDLRGNNSK